MVSERAGTEQSHEAEPSGDGEETFEPPAEPEYPKDGVGFDGSSVEEILKDRDERLAEENRPENAEVSNAGREFDGRRACSPTRTASRRPRRSTPSTTA